jgi:hypothetical protein
VVGVLRGIGSALETAGLAMRNWDSITQIAGIQINQTLSDIGATFQWLETVAGAFLDWFRDNWKSIFADALTVTLTLFQSYGDILKGQFDQIKGFLSDPLHFEVDFSKFNPVDQFKKVVADLSKVELKTLPLVTPKLEFDHREADWQIADITQEIVRREAARPKRDPGQAAADQSAAAKEEDQPGPSVPAAPKAQFLDLQTFAKSLQLGALSGKDQVADRTAKATEGTRDEMKRLSEAALKKGKAKLGIDPRAIAVGPA